MSYEQVTNRPKSTNHQHVSEGMSLRAASRISGCSINTVTKLLVDTGKDCQSFHDETVHRLNSKRIEADEIWSCLL